MLGTWRRFWKLHRSRNFGFSANPLPISEISNLLDEYGIDDMGERLDEIYLIQAMDGAYFEWKSEQTPKK